MVCVNDTMFFFSFNKILQEMPTRNEIKVEFLWMQLLKPLASVGLLIPSIISM